MDLQLHYASNRKSFQADILNVLFYNFRAQKVVSDMLVQLDKKNSRIDKLESVVLGLQATCVGEYKYNLYNIDTVGVVLMRFDLISM